MVIQSKFTHTIDCIELEDGDIFVLPDEEAIAYAESQAAATRQTLQENEAELQRLESQTKVNGQESRVTGQEPAEEEKREKLGQARARVSAARTFLETLESGVAGMRELRKNYAKQTKHWKFELHRFSWAERAFTQEEAREIDAGGAARINNSRFVLGLLERCIESWPFEEPVTGEAIGTLPPAVLESLWAALASRSEPSTARLSFRGAGGARLAVGKPAVAG